MGKLDGKVAIVTGSSRGIGQVTARLLASEGAKVLCVARTLHEGDKQLKGSLDATVADIRAGGGEASALVCDLSSEEQCTEMVAKAREIYGPCDLLVNNAAILYLARIKDYPVNRWVRFFAINVHAPFILSRLVLPEMIARQQGAIVNISSVGAVGPGRGPYANRKPYGGTCYGASKAALERFTQGLAEEVYADGVAVSCVAPSQVVATAGAIEARMVKGPDDPRAEPPEYTARCVLLLATEPLDRVSGRVVYTQMLLKEYGLVETPRGAGVDFPGSGYSQR